MRLSAPSSHILDWIVRSVALASAGFLFLLSATSHQTNSLSLTSVSDTLSSSRLSWVGRLGAGNSIGSTTVTIDTTQDAYESTSSANLFVNDTVRIGNGGSMGSYTVSEILSASQFSVSSGLASGQTTAGMFVIATRSATHTLAFTSATAVANGSFRILIPTVSNSTNAVDGIPDRNGFDFTNTAAASFPVTCPSDVGATFNFVSGTATPSAVTINGRVYHAFECRYSGTGSVGQAFSGFVVGNSSTSLINPAANSNHVAGTSDTYPFIVQHLDSTHAVIDQTAGSIAVVESVRISATVDEQITFKVNGVDSGTSVCGLTTDVTTTFSTIPLGTLSTSSFVEAAQYLIVSTNATSGYTVTGIENDQLGKDGNACVGGGPTFGNSCIPDSLGDNGTMSHTTTDTWTDTAVKGFGFTLSDANSTVTEAFNFSSGFRQFADSENGETAQTLFSDASVADSDNAYVCLKAIVSTGQTGGTYTNTVTYRATASF